MTDEGLNTILLAVIIPSVVVIVAVSATNIIGTPAALARKRRKRQRAALDELLSTASGDEVQIDWIDYKYLSKQQVVDAAGNHGWSYVDQWYRKRSWYLRFSRLAQASVIAGNTRREQPAERLAAALAGAELDRAGFVRVKTEDYSELKQREIDNILAGHSYSVAKRIPREKGEMLLLTKVGESAVHVRPAPGIGRVSVGQYRDTPAIARYVASVSNARGADPLSDAEMDRVLGREVHWQKRSTRALVMLVLGVCIGPAVLLVDLRDGAMTIAGLVIGLVACILAFAGFLRYNWAKRKRRKEIGHELDTYRHISELYRQRNDQRGADPAR